jgi:8-oxo-dGTP pyrophosphatase MutT (NUDIX family)
MKDIVEKLFDRSSAMVFLVGVILLIIGASGGVTVGTSALKIGNPTWQIVIGVIGFIMIVVGIIWIARDGLSRTSKPEKVSPKGNAVSKQTPSFFISNRELNIQQSFLDFIEQSDKEMFVAGVALGFVTRHRATFEKILEKGATLRFLLLDPESPDVDIVAQMFDVDALKIRNDIEGALKDLEVLRNKSHDTDGKVDIRLMSREPAFSFAISDPKTTHGCLSASLRIYGQSAITRPYFVLRVSDEWFEVFVQSCENLWLASTPWPKRDQIPSKQVFEKAGVVPYQIRNNKIEVLLITARTDPRKWIFPVGNVEPKENLRRAAIRECVEESGFVVEDDKDLSRLMAIELERKDSVDKMTFFLGPVIREKAEYELDRNRKWVPLSELMDEVADDFRSVATAAHGILNAIEK